MSHAGPPSGPEQLSGIANKVTELLEVLWERGRDISPAPLSTSQLRAMYVLERGAGISLRALTEALGSTPPSVSRLCDRLHAVGFLERMTSSASRREVELRLSDRGQAYLRDLRLRREEHLRTLVEAMPLEAQEALHAGLVHFLAAAEEVDGRADRRSRFSPSGTLR